MSSLEVHHLSGRLELRCVRPVWRSSPEVDREVARIWNGAATNSDRSLHDGTILCVSELRDPVEVAPVAYRYFFAQTVAPRLFSHPLTALAVSGIVTCEGKLVLGRRSESVVQDAGMLELMPSGSVDADRVSPDGEVDVAAQFRQELYEELGIPAEQASEACVLGLIEDRDKHVVDVVIGARLICTFAALVHAHSRLQRPEYTSLLAVTPDELQQMIDSGRDRISAVSIAIFENFSAALARGSQES
jgi:hypothetical protein